jgi:hypothetical protein
MTWATDHLFVAGGDFVAEHWREVQAQTGVSAIVAVAVDRPGDFVDPRPWALLWLPVAEESAYTLDQLQLGAQFIDSVIAANRKALLHGPQAMHRVRPLVAAHLLARGKSLQRVLREMEQRPWLPPYKGDAALLEKFLAERSQ